MVIQRIQTLYLLMAAVLCAVAAFLPFGHLVVEGQGAGFEFTPLCMRLADAADYTFSWLCAILFLSAVVAVIAIFSFKRLKCQTRWAVASVVLLVGYYAGVFFAQSVASGELDAAFRVKWPLCLPLVSLILTLMAIKAIAHDSKILRDANSMRLRD